MTVVATEDRQKRVKAMAVRVALSPSFQHFFNANAAPSVWEELVRTWDDDTLHTMGLILDEEAAMLKEVSTTAMRKHEVNKTKLLQKIEQMRVQAHHTND